MGSPFQDACAAASSAVDTVFGTPWWFIPMAADDPNGRKSLDPDRPPMAVTAFFFDPYARAFSNQTRRQGLKPERPGHASSRPVLDLALAQLPYPIREGDRVRCDDGASQHFGSVWQIAEPRPDGTGRAELDLTRLQGRN